MGVDFNVGAKLVADRGLQRGRDVMRLAVGHAAIEFEIKADGFDAVDFLNGDVMDRQTLAGGGHQHALQHALVVQRAGVGGHSHEGVREILRDRGCDLVLDLHDAFNGERTRDADDQLAYDARACGSQAQILNLRNTRHGGHNFANVLRQPVGGLVDQRVDGTPSQTPACYSDEKRNAECGQRVALLKAVIGRQQPKQHEA